MVKSNNSKVSVPCNMGVQVSQVYVSLLFRKRRVCNVVMHTAYCSTLAHPETDVIDGVLARFPVGRAR